MFGTLHWSPGLPLFTAPPCEARPANLAPGVAQRAHVLMFVAQNGAYATPCWKQEEQRRCMKDTKIKHACVNVVQLCRVSLATLANSTVLCGLPASLALHGLQLQTGFTSFVPITQLLSLPPSLPPSLPLSLGLSSSRCNATSTPNFALAEHVQTRRRPSSPRRPSAPT